MVVVALLVMMALAAPFIVRSRESSRAAICLAKQQTIGQAILEYEAFFQVLPVGALKEEQDHPSFGVIARILPLLDEEAVAEEIDWNASPVGASNEAVSSIAAPAILHCPADDVGLVDKRSISYVVNAGSDAAMLGPEEAKPELLGAFDYAHAVSIADFQDGAANTALLSERLVGNEAAGQSSPYSRQEQGKPPRDLADVTGYQFTAGNPDQFATECAQIKADHRGWVATLGRNWTLEHHYVHVLTPNPKVTDCGHASTYPLVGAISARSYHPRSVQVTFADGRSESINDQIDPTIWRSFGSRSGHDGAPKP